MEIILRNDGGRPIYEQICAQAKAQIIAGTLLAGEALPSIRALAKDLRISVITTKRAYEELERDGFIETVPGKGCFVAGCDSALVREHRMRQIEAHLAEIAHLAKGCGITNEELVEMLGLIKEED
ncbi:MAG: GntR family transcriptional regulator [Clostridia bacterium]